MAENTTTRTTLSLPGVLHQPGSKPPPPPHSPGQGPTPLIPGLCRGTHLRNSSYLHVLLPRDPGPSERPGPQSESQPGPVYMKERECLLPSGPSIQDNLTALKSEIPSIPCCLSLQNTQVEGQSSVLCLSAPGGQPPPRADPQELGQEIPLCLLPASAAHEHTCSLAPNPAEVCRGNGLLSLKGKKAGPCSHPYLMEPRAEGKCLRSSSWVRGRHGTPVPRSPGSGQHKQRLCSAACLLYSRRSCGQRGAVRTIRYPGTGLLLHS